MSEIKACESRISEIEKELKALSDEKQTLRERHKQEIEEIEGKCRDLNKEKRTTQNRIEAIRNDQFKSELFRRYRHKLGDEVAERVYAKAWERGHSGGYNEVENEFVDLMELFP